MMAGCYCKVFGIVVCVTYGLPARVRKAAELSREASIASLKHTHGDVLRALHNELASWRLDTGLLDHLVWEYAAFRRVALSVPRTLTPRSRPRFS